MEPHEVQTFSEALDCAVATAFDLHKIRLKTVNVMRRAMKEPTFPSIVVFASSAVCRHLRLPAIDEQVFGAKRATGLALFDIAYDCLPIACALACLMEGDFDAMLRIPKLKRNLANSVPNWNTRRYGILTRNGRPR